MEASKVYQQFKLPWIIPEWFLPVKYAEDYMVKYYLNKIRFNFARWFRVHNWIDGKTPLYEMSPYIDKYFKMRGNPQAAIFWGGCLFVTVISLSIVITLLLCMCRCLCGKKADPKVAPAKKLANKTE